MPMPPASRMYLDAVSSRRKLFRGRMIRIVSWTCTVLCSALEPPRPASSFRTAKTYRSRSAGSLLSEYCRTKGPGRWTSTWLPAVGSGSGLARGSISSYEFIPGASNRIWRTRSSSIPVVEINSRFSTGPFMTFPSAGGRSERNRAARFKIQSPRGRAHRFIFPQCTFDFVHAFEDEYAALFRGERVALGEQHDDPAGDASPVRDLVADILRFRHVQHVAAAITVWR